MTTPFERPSGENPHAPTSSSLRLGHESFTEERRGLLSQTPFYDDFLEMVIGNGASIRLNTTADGGDFWVASFNFRRLERVVMMWVEQQSWYPGLTLEVCAAAHWIESVEPLIVFPVFPERRWYGLTDRASRSDFRQILALAFRDAKRFSVSDVSRVEPTLVPTHRARLGRPVRAPLEQ